VADAMLAATIGEWSETILAIPNNPSGALDPFTPASLIALTPAFSVRSKIDRGGAVELQSLHCCAFETPMFPKSRGCIAS